MSKISFQSQAMLIIPLSALRCLSRDKEAQKAVLEVDMKNIKKLNDPETIDELLNEAHLEYAAGNYKSFSDVEDLIAELRT